MPAAIYRYCGKARPAAEAGADYHLLSYHCLDVAACGWLLLSDDFPWARTLAGELDISMEQLRRFFVFFLCLHDLGKFSRTFQNLVTQGRFPALVEAVEGMPYSVRHDSLGFWLWKDAQELRAAFAGFFGLSDQQVRVNGQLRIWFEIVTGHHGRPPRRASQSLGEHFLRADIEAAAAFVRAMLALWLRPEDIPLLQDKALAGRLKARSWTLAGLTVLADWLGSNQTCFAYCDEPMALDKYWQQHALPAAREAVEMAGVERRQVEPFSDLQQLFPFIRQPTPLQRYAVEQPIPDQPQLFILEDVTGAGKTEAAMILVHRLMSQGLADGLYVGLPTMATANAMYLRMADCYQRLYRPDQQVSLVLAHGSRHLSETFQQSLGGQPEDVSYDADELSASAYCNRWIADNRKKALLADIGVGTIDQALLGILPAHYQSLRLLGLNRKVLLVDEVHAYDDYMLALLASLLEMHARQGGSAILLSATLPQQMKKRLLVAYAKGRDLAAPALSSVEYPLATQFPALEGYGQVHVPTRPEVERQVRVRRLSTEAEVQTLIRQAVEAGRCVCWIRNTVNDARRSYDQLSQELADLPGSVHLFHSRFAMLDRQRMEEDVLHWFGKESTYEQRKGRLLIATQVVEQSLDLDFDELITDLAPIDLLLQRAGRLHRHVRDTRGDRLPQGGQDQRPAATLHVLSPEPTEQANAQWLSAMSGTLAVYRDIGQLWRSARVLFGREGYAMPEDARELIEGVYSADTPLCTPAALDGISLAADGKRRADADMARLNQLDLAAGYTQSSSDTGWSEEVNIPTRLSDETLSVVLLRQAEDGSWQPYADHPQFAWDLSALQLREGLWREAAEALSAEMVTALDTLKEQVPALKWHQLFPLKGELNRFYSAQQGWMGASARPAGRFQQSERIGRCQMASSLNTVSTPVDFGTLTSPAACTPCSVWSRRASAAGA